jgi:hypothetical protein
LTVQGNDGIPERTQLAELALDVGVRAKEFDRLFSEVTSQVERWREFAEQAGVGEPLTQRIRNGIASRQNVVG